MDKLDLYIISNVIGDIPRVKIGIDETILFDGLVPDRHLSYNIDLVDGPHTLWMELLDKKANNVSIETDEDTFVEFENVAVNGSMMNYLLNDFGYTEIDWRHHEDVAQWFKENHGEVPSKLLKSKHLNLKGFYKFCFDSPIKNFLDKHLKIDPNYEKYYNFPLEEYNRLENKLLNLNTDNLK